MKRLQRGQAMVEFSMLLPLLLLLSFGTLEVGLYLQRRLVAGGATFVAARAAAVQGPRASGTTTRILTTYSQDSGSRWVAELASTAKVGKEGPRLIRIGVAKEGDAWTGALTGSVELLGGHLDPQAKWRSEYPISAEYVPGGAAGQSYGTKPTDIFIDYRAKLPYVDRLPDVSGLLRSLPGGKDSNTVLALNMAEQAAMKNPGDRTGSTSPSKMYVTPYAEEREFRHAEKLAGGIDNLVKLSAGAFATCQAAFGSGEPDALAACKAITEPFAKADQAVNFAKVADEMESYMYKLYGAHRPKP
jgi:hypothetical protein